jgi:hypothetical protein
MDSCQKEILTIEARKMRFLRSITGNISRERLCNEDLTNRVKPGKLQKNLGTSGL